MVRRKWWEGMRGDRVFVGIDWGDWENVKDLIGERVDRWWRMGGFKVWWVKIGG